MTLERVQDAADPRVADYVGLTDAARRMRHDPANGFFIAEGEPVIRRAAAAGYPARSVLLSAARASVVGREMEAIGCPVLVMDKEVLETTTGFNVHRGALASFTRLPVPSWRDVAYRARRVAVVEDVNNHTNLGAVFRCAAALGMEAVLLSPTCCDPLYRRAIRVSMGQVFAVPYAVLDPWPGSLAELQGLGFRLLALTPDPAAVPLDRIRPAPSDRLAVLLGAEGPGLTATALGAADVAVRIPMAAGVDSLNVAAAASVAFWVLGSRPESG